MCTDPLLHCCTGIFTAERGWNPHPALQDVQCCANREFFACVCGEDRYVCAISHMACSPVCSLAPALGGELVAAARGNPKQIAKGRRALSGNKHAYHSVIYAHHQGNNVRIAMPSDTYPVTNITLL